MVSFPILPLSKPQRSSRFARNCNRTGRKKKKPTKGRMTLRGRSVICPGLLPSRFRGPTGNLPLFDSAWLSGARMLDARTGEGSEERRRGADAWAPLLSSAAPPGFWAVLQEIGPGFDALPGFWAVFRLSAVVRTISRDITPGQKLPYRRRPALRPTKPPRPSPARSRRPAGPALAAEAPALWVLTLRGRSVICPKIGQITLRPLSVRAAVGSTGPRNASERQPKRQDCPRKQNPTHVVGNVKTL